MKDEHVESREARASGRTLSCFTPLEIHLSAKTARNVHRWRITPHQTEVQASTSLGHTSTLFTTGTSVDDQDSENLIQTEKTHPQAPENDSNLKDKNRGVNGLSDGKFAKRIEARTSSGRTLWLEGSKHTSIGDMNGTAQPDKDAIGRVSVDTVHSDQENAELDPDLVEMPSSP